MLFLSRKDSHPFCAYSVAVYSSWLSSLLGIRLWCQTSGFHAGMRDPKSQTVNHGSLTTGCLIRAKGCVSQVARALTYCACCALLQGIGMNTKDMPSQFYQPPVILFFFGVVSLPNPINPKPQIFFFLRRKKVFKKKLSSFSQGP